MSQTPQDPAPPPGGSEPSAPESVTPEPPTAAPVPAAQPPMAPTAPPAAPVKKRRTGLIILLVILGVLFVLIAGCAVLVGVVFNAASDAIDPVKNTQTGLVDGNYVLESSASVTVNDQCSFTGTAYDAATEQEVARTVTVVGSGLDCSLGTDTSIVVFTVVNGTADITDVG